jgi:hypothetical protein
MREKSDYMELRSAKRVAASMDGIVIPLSICDRSSAAMMDGSNRRISVPPDRGEIIILLPFVTFE